MPRRIVLGTAGHIDHGKTSLVKALTGIDTDRLKEEKARGITIELGFAHLTLDDGQRVSVVDVPGHERFVRTMVAGATGVDLVALVIAADEGIMPQTREHIDVCQVLGLRQGVVVLTKVDLVDQDWLDLVTEDIKAYLAQTFLKEAPILRVSAVTGQGLPELRAKLTELCAALTEREESGPFRLPVDRVFTMKGFGTVVTGTSLSGRIEVGAAATLYPGRQAAKIRGLQVHGREEAQASAGLRVAVNLAGLERGQIERGHVLASQDSMLPAHRLEARLTLLGSAPKPLKNRAAVHFHVGAADHLARIVPLGQESLEPGQSDYIQLLLEEPAVCFPGDHFVIRSYSPPLTIGGGVILGVAPPRRKRFDPAALAALQTLDTGRLFDRLALLVAENRLLGLSRGELSVRLGLTDKELDKPLAELLTKRTIVRYDKERQRFVHAQTLARLTTEIEALVAAFHQANPLKPGLPKEEIKTRLKLHADPRVIIFQVGRLVEEGRLKADQDLVALAGHQISLAGETGTLKETIAQAFQSGGLTPPRPKELEERLGPAKIKDVLALLVKEGRLIKVKDDLYFDREVVAGLEARLVAELGRRREMSTQDFKDLTGLSRKYLIPLAEHFDRTGVTIRVGEVRRLREKLA